MALMEKFDVFERSAIKHISITTGISYFMNFILSTFPQLIHADWQEVLKDMLFP